MEPLPEDNADLCLYLTLSQTQGLALYLHQLTESR